MRILRSAVALALLGVLMVAAPASARLTTLCTGYVGCAQAGYTDHGYSAVSSTMYWQQYGGHNCTNYVAYRMITTNKMSPTKPWVGRGNAHTWGHYNAAITDGVPAVGAVAWWDSNAGLGGVSGHVSYVERVVSANEIWVSDDSASGDFHWRKITRDGSGWPSGFIHFKDMDTPVPGPGGFVDVTEDHTFAADIEWLSTTGITTGYTRPDQYVEFRPQQPVLREQMAAFLYRLMGKPPVTDLPAESPFTDVPTTHTFYAEIVWLSRSGVSTGYVDEDGSASFRPEQPVLREQMAAFLQRLTGDPAPAVPTTQGFADVGLDHTFVSHIAWLATTGITTGYASPEGLPTFRPEQPVLREQMAAFLNRYTQRP
ncbi:S-layer homology domain-containing protein [Aeromicrobium sp. Sec7.5]|uniref:S-layer homology domain-containing protein n=1 Tax=Aeromicrobium sp. Sec7.5 TaxID=3121276 RepID=UPI002FE45309